MWDLVGRLGSQLRVLPGAVIGWDLSAALALGDALSVPPLALAELLPVIEAVMVRKLNEELAGNSGPGVRSWSSRSGLCGAAPRNVRRRSGASHFARGPLRR